jgi:signal transduction histidine kinase
LGFLFEEASMMREIVKRPWMGIKAVIRRTAVFAGLFAFVYGVFIVFTILGREFFKNVLGWNEWAAMIPVGVIITLALKPLENFLTNMTDRFLFQKKSDTHELLKVFTNKILTILDLPKLMQQTVAELAKIMKLDSASVLLLEREKGVYRLAASYGVREKKTQFEREDALISLMKEANSEGILKDKSLETANGASRLGQSFQKLNAELCLPMELHDELIGVMALGTKKSGRDFTAEDRDILSTLARTEAIAISNARLFEELLKTQAQAAQREKMAVIGTLAAGINHEICNPLSIVRGQCEMFLLNLRDGFYNQLSSEELLRISSEIMQKVIKETDRATGITKKLSGFAKPSRHFEFEEVFIEHELEEVLGLIGHDMKLNNITVEKEFSEDFPSILADRKQIQEVLFNIIRNAAQAIQKADGRIVVAGTRQNGCAVVTLSDNGCGIPENDRAHIFSPFYTTKAANQGTGLGLFIVKQVVKRNEGEISVESTEGVGTKFTLRFSALKPVLAGRA